MTDKLDPDHSYLKRLPAGHYRGQSYIHWSMAIDKRKEGWLVPEFYCNFKVVLTHTMFRYGLTCPIYCCMPDHIHMLWIGILDGSDQRNAVKFFRKQINLVLLEFDAQFQKQPYDHVLREHDRTKDGFEKVVEYICLNPERAELVDPGGHRKYPYTGCLVPGYPNLCLWQQDYWELFWQTYACLRKSGLTRTNDIDES
jgi:putative transposase